MEELAGYTVGGGSLGKVDSGLSKGRSICIVPSTFASDEVEDPDGMEPYEYSIKWGLVVAE
ncbi:unnamed protein product, partial [Ilex paraguariensis]